MIRVTVIWIPRDTSDWTELTELTELRKLLGLMELLSPRANGVTVYEGTCV